MKKLLLPSDAEYERVDQFDISDLEPQVARPSKPDRVVPMSQLENITITNFKGRSGDPTHKKYLASPRTVAFSAVKRKISHYLDEKLSYYQLREKRRNLQNLNPI